MVNKQWTTLDSTRTPSYNALHHTYNALPRGLTVKTDYMEGDGSSVGGIVKASDSDYDYLSPCIYCGMPANSIDHVPPRHMRAQLSACGIVATHEREVLACRECNSVLGARPLITIGERREYVKEQLRRRYAKYLRIPNWTSEQLGEFGDSLRGMIQRNMAKRDDVLKRLQWRGAMYE